MARLSDVILIATLVTLSMIAPATATNFKMSDLKVAVGPMADRAAKMKSFVAGNLGSGTSGRKLRQEESNELRLLRAIVRGDNEAFFELVNMANVNFPVSSETTTILPLEFAVLRGRDDYVRALISAGADVNARNGDESTILDITILEGDATIVKILLDAGATLSKSSLGLAVLENEPRIVQLLIDAGANVQNDDVLSIASFLGHSPVVNVLLDAGADGSMEGDSHDDVFCLCKGDPDFEDTCNPRC